MTRPPKLNIHPLIQRLKWVADPVGYMETAAQQHPDIFAAEVIGFGDQFIFVNHPQGIQQLLTQDRQQFFASGKENAILKPLLGEYSIVMLEGNPHRKRRKLLLPPFHGERMQAYGKLIWNLTDKIFAQLPINQTFTARKITQEISLQVILEAVYGLYEDEKSQKLKYLLTKVTDVFSSPLSSALLFFDWLQKDLGAWSPWGNFLRQQQEIDSLIYGEITERRAKGYENRNDILSLMMSARDESGDPMSDRELRDELMTLMFAGHETTATAMAWALYWIHRLPEVRQKLVAEIDSLGSNPEPMAIAKLPYLTAVCQETLRIYPVAMLTFPRVVTEPIELLGYQLEPGMIAMGCIYLAHQREDIYSNHHQFKPERFLEKQYSQYEFLPFGGGARRCIGEALAQLEMKLVLANILSNYELTLVSQSPEKPHRRGVTLAPTGGVKMLLKAKRTLSTVAEKPNQTILTN
ncbi:Unspecific monooxygenase [Stanieria cyanosphaera PCC 7437]|uniref:Unspecific monooxygenase n=1 Tax=Stanieria cyanosphaera (strain ATCC 29371 / PCC 7437) TaxID=111780 RepID=K9XTA8_STAC7|nr:cytochrome P450 [Stanieria cyanosphaera]AFZ35316.1 Unspecific monooxygenase [Stanieria cyanosphaera PCC 7437]